MGEYKNVYVERLYENQGFPAFVNLVLPEHHRILDVGCGNGANIYLLSQRGHNCCGVTLSEVEADIVRDRGFECVAWDLMDEQLPFQEQSFDALILSHVLEHLPWPEEILSRYLRLLRPGGGVYIALPNILHLVQRLKFLCGEFRYTEIGVMDRTHLRFFTFDTSRLLAENCGLSVVRHFGIGQCPAGPLRKWAPDLCRWIDQWVTRHWPGLFAVHLILIAEVSDKQ